jgi:hypothetical protein
MDEAEQTDSVSKTESVFARPATRNPQLAAFRSGQGIHHGRNEAFYHGGFLQLIDIL